MKISSKADLINIASSKGYRPEILEKVCLLLEFSEQIKSSKTIRETLVLKGGTAINLFCTKELPRLSVDLDFNYIGSLDLDKMRSDREKISDAILDNAAKLNMSVKRNPQRHAGSKVVLVYNSLMDNRGHIEIDINYMYRIPIWDITSGSPAPWLKQVELPILDIHELAAGKLKALLERDASRDLYDSYQLLTKWDLDFNKLRTSFVLYLAMSDLKWNSISLDNITYNVDDIRKKLIPVLHKETITNYYHNKIEEWAIEIISECKKRLKPLLPLNNKELEFLRLVQEDGVIKPDLLSNDSSLCEKIIKHPLINWKAQKKS
jgi:predicted nucleotidyltransferase component of viral defense system